MRHLNTLSLALALLAHSAAPAQTVDHTAAIANMQARCVDVMDQGLCRVALDRSNFSGPTVLLSGVGRVSTEAYLRFRGAGFEKNAQGKWVMCELIPQFCANWDSDECKSIRSNYRQTPL